jgi:hypothetical protein
VITRRANVQVFLEGIQIPFESITLSMGPSRMNVCQIEVIPVIQLFNISPRTIVQVFYFDSDDNTWKNFFEGEVIGHSYSKNASGRAMVLTCADLANYWQYSYAFFLNFVDLTNLSLSDQVTLFTGADPTTVADPKQASRINTVREISKKAVQLLSSTQSRDTVAGIRQVFQLISQANSFYTKRMGGLRVNDRLVSLPDNQVQLLMDPTAFDIIKYILDNQQVNTPVIQVLSMMLQVLYQNFWSLSLPSVSPDTGNPINFLILPASFLTAPPRCNVIFPDYNESFSYSRNFLAEPTRFTLYTGNAPQGTLQYFFSPPSFREKVTAIPQAQAKQQDLRMQNILATSSNPELDETILGIIPEQESLQLDVFAAVRKAFLSKFGDLSTATAAAKKTIEVTLQQITDFEFLLRKFGGRTIPITTPFNPNIHPAFPILMLDQNAHIFGSPMSVVHTIDADGQARTQIQCSFARHQDVLGNVIQNPPPWLNKAYDPNGIGSSTFNFTNPDGSPGTVPGAYTKLIAKDMTSIMTNIIPVFGPNGQTTQRQPTSQEDAANLLFDLWSHSGDKATFTTEYTKRPVQTREQALAFLGIQQTNADVLTGTVYDPNKRVVIEQIKAALVASGNAIKEV